MAEAVERQGSLMSIDSLEVTARELVASSKGNRIWLFSGEMGAGKTTLIKAIGKELGVKQSMSSPTFSIINEYHTAKELLFHFDFYRLKNEQEAYDIGVNEYFESGNYCFIEWPEKLETLLPESYFKITLRVQSPTTRTIEYAIHD
jgi:tRNA threonylcarbamoyladenosine biosynthesis protein TsaE